MADDSIPPPRPLARRIEDTLRRLDVDVDAWVATGDEAGGAYLIPLSFLWDGETLLFSTASASITGRNLHVSGKTRIGLGPTRDVVLIDGSVETIEVADLPDQVGDEFAVKTGCDPRTYRSGWRYFRVRPDRIQAWREANELEGRDLMIGGPVAGGDV